MNDIYAQCADNRLTFDVASVEQLPVPRECLRAVFDNKFITSLENPDCSQPLLTAPRLGQTRSYVHVVVVDDIIKIGSGLTISGQAYSGIILLSAQFMRNVGARSDNVALTLAHELGHILGGHFDDPHIEGDEPASTGHAPMSWEECQRGDESNLMCDGTTGLRLDNGTCRAWKAELPERFSNFRDDCSGQMPTESISGMMP